ncbi:MAG: SH3 domain-containing protein [Deltaproteobacteria bacterium]|nr:SH3 domain-containing protein [Deltaproteobacteria bacterium]
MTVRKISIAMSFLICATALTAFAAAQKMMSVQVNTGVVRVTPSFLGRIVTRLSYGDRVYVIEEEDSWTRVGLSPDAVKGWIHSSALTPKKVVLKAGTEDVEVGTSGEEIALAGKGFNEQVESEFRAENSNLDFTWIDRMETYVVSEKQMKRFLKEGELSCEGGA